MQSEPAGGDTRPLRATVMEYKIPRTEGIVLMTSEGVDIGMMGTKIGIAPALRTTQRIMTAANKIHLATLRMNWQGHDSRKVSKHDLMLTTREVAQIIEVMASIGLIC